MLFLLFLTNDGIHKVANSYCERRDYFFNLNFHPIKRYLSTYFK